MTEYREPGWETPSTSSRRAVWSAPTGPVTQPSPTKPRAVPPAPPVASPARRTGFVGGLRRCVRIAAWTVVLFCGAMIALVIAYRWVAPPTSTLILAQRLTGTRIERAWRPLTAISPHLARAVIMSEDAGFCGHRGVDFDELERAYERGIEGGNSGGASTIAMQVTKNLFLWPSKSYVRKAIEIPLTLAADRWWGKRRTLEIYLNVVEWGPGIFGAEAAARAYFHKPALELTEAEAALMAVALPSPLARNPAKPSERQKRMAGVVQGRMKAAARNVRCLAQVGQIDQ